MNITKLGHCCLLIVENNVHILTDPGNYSSAQDSLTDIDAVIITHEHVDHFHIPSLKQVLLNNPKAMVFSTQSVSALLAKENIVCKIVKQGDSFEVKGVIVECFGELHEVIYSSISQVENTGFYFSNGFFYPGDAFTIPSKKVRVLALPVAGPWMKVSEAIDYALKINPVKCFPVHDGIYKNSQIASFAPNLILNKNKISFFIPELEKEFKV